METILSFGKVLTSYWQQLWNPHLHFLPMRPVSILEFTSSSSSLFKGLLCQCILLLPKQMTHSDTKGDPHFHQITFLLNINYPLAAKSSMSCRTCKNTGESQQMSIEVNEILLTFTTAVEITKAGMQLLLKYIFKAELLFQSSLNAAGLFFF